MTMRRILFPALLALLISNICMAQGPGDSAKTMPRYKNVIRYNLSGALLFGVSKYIVFGYERMVNPRQSISVNVGTASLPKLISIVTDSFETNKDSKRNGLNASVDYRFYLSSENRFDAPHGFYIGPYYSYNEFTRETVWDFKTRNNTATSLTTDTKFHINTIGFEVGYQLILWKRLTMDFVMVGPGYGIYKYKAKFDGNINASQREDLFDGLKQLLTQKFPGMDFVFGDKEINSNGVLRTSTIGYRYIVHIGFIF